MKNLNSKKLIQTTMAATVAVSAMAVVTPTANASETLNLGPLQEKMELMNSKFTQKVKLGEAVTKINNDTDGKVTSLVAKYVDSDTDKAAAKAIAQGLVGAIYGELAKTNSSDVNVASAVDTFRTNNRTNLETVLGDLPYTHLVNSLVELTQVLYTEVTFEDVLAKLEPGQTGKRDAFKAAYLAAKDKYVKKSSENQMNFDEMKRSLNEIGLDLEDLFDLQLDLVSTYDDSGNTIQNALFEAAFASLNPTPVENDNGNDNNSGSSGPSGPSSVGGTTSPGNTNTGSPVVSTVEKVTAADGKVIAVAKVDESKLTAAIAKGEITDKVAITISNAQGEVAEAVISSKAISALVNNNPNTVIEIATADAKYELPAKEINIESLAKSLGVAAEDVEISIQVSVVEDTANVVAKNNLESVAPVLDFTILARSGDKNLTISKFSQYVNREVEATKTVNPKNIVAVRINDNNTLSPVPTVADGNKISFKSRSNSKYTVVENDVTFADIAGSWARNDIETLANKLVIKGVDDQNFAPKAETTRAQLATLLTRTLGLQGQQATKVSFKDVKGNEWFANDLAVAVESGLVGGYEDGTFKPNKTITRQEAAAMIKRAMDFAAYDKKELNSSISASSQFKDYNKVGNWAKGDIEVIAKAGIMGGNEKGEFNPTANTTREQLASILKRFMTFVKFTN